MPRTASGRVRISSRRSPNGIHEGVHIAQPSPPRKSCVSEKTCNLKHCTGLFLREGGHDTSPSLAPAGGGVVF